MALLRQAMEDGEVAAKIQLAAPFTARILERVHEIMQEPQFATVSWEIVQIAAEMAVGAIMWGGLNQPQPREVVREQVEGARRFIWVGYLRSKQWWSKQ
ncbi:MAG: hypothetical protein KGI71_04655 [Patescibacteria group bacterium]|nr:hypothetical protein [Patescibacteria group bacterium]